MKWIIVSLCGTSGNGGEKEREKMRQRGRRGGKTDGSGGVRQIPSDNKSVQTEGTLVTFTSTKTVSLQIKPSKVGITSTIHEGETLRFKLANNTTLAID